MIGLKLEGEETFFGERIESPEEFIEDLCERVNTVYSTAMDEDDKMNQLIYQLKKYHHINKKISKKSKPMTAIIAIAG